MANFFYIDAKGHKQVVNDQQLKSLAAQGVIAPHTQLETDNGKKGMAGQISGLFPATSSSTQSSSQATQAVSALQSIAKQFFCTNCGKIVAEQEVTCKSCGTKPTGHKNHCRQCGTAISPGQVICDLCGANIAEHSPKKGRSWVAICGILLVLIGGVFGGFFAWEVFSTSSLVNALNEGLNEGLDNEIFSQEPMELVDVSVKWTNKTAASAAGEFTVKAKTIENLYQLVDYDAGLQKLEIIKLYEREFNDALTKFRGLPMQHQNDLREGMPQGLSEIQFYDLLVPQGEEVTMTGSVELTKHNSGKWQVERFLLYPFSCGDDFTPESKLQEKEYKLDDPPTKAAIESIIKKREKFAAEVGQVWNEWKQQQLNADEETRRKSQQEAEQARLAREAAEQERLRQVAIQDQIAKQAAADAIIFIKEQNFFDACLPQLNKNAANEAMQKLTIDAAFATVPQFSRQRWGARSGVGGTQIVSLDFVIVNKSGKQNQAKILFTADTVSNAATRISRQPSISVDGVPITTPNEQFFKTMHDELIKTIL